MTNTKTSMKIVFLDTDTMGADISLSPISELGDFTGYPNTSPDEAAERIRDCEILIVNKVNVTKELIDSAPELKLICVAATGTNNIDTVHAERKGIAVKNAVNYSTESVAQTTMMQILALVGRHAQFDRYVKSGEYAGSGMFTNVKDTFFELKGKKLGIIGLGNIGRRVAGLAEAFGMEISYSSLSGTQRQEKYRRLEIGRLLEESDIVSIHAPLNDRSRGLIDRQRLMSMKRSAFLINMGRGGIVEEDALAQAIDEGLIAGAAIDVFEKEPLGKDSPLMKVKNRDRLILSPHIGWASREARERLTEAVAENIRSFLAE